MIASAQTIRRRCDPVNGPPMIHPFNERTVAHGLTFGLSPAGYDVRVAENLELRPGEFLLASTIESFHMPMDLLGVVHDKSTWARMGICVQNTVIEPGWVGKALTLEVTNHSPRRVFIPAGSPIAQVVFHILDEPTVQPYAGRYQFAPKGASPAAFSKTGGGPVLVDDFGDMRDIAGAHVPPAIEAELDKLDPPQEHSGICESEPFDSGQTG